jgi:hypothetical protein
MRDYLIDALKPFAVQNLAPGFWRQYAPESLRKHFPKFSLWFWKPSGEKRRRKK